MEHLLKVSKKLRKLAGDHEAQELILWIDNDAKLYNMKYDTYFKNLVIKKAQGKYDPAKAPQLFMYLAERAARSYAKEFGNESEWKNIFDKQTRMEASKELVSEFEELFADGELDKYIPKKYQKKSK